MPVQTDEDLVSRQAFPAHDPSADRSVGTFELHEIAHEWRTLQNWNVWMNPRIRAASLGCHFILVSTFVMVFIFASRLRFHGCSLQSWRRTITV